MNRRGGLASFNLFVLAAYAFCLQTLLFKGALFTHEYITALSMIANALVGSALGALCTLYVSAPVAKKRFGLLFVALFVSGWVAAAGTVLAPAAPPWAPWTWPAFAISSAMIVWNFRSAPPGRVFLLDMLGCTASVLAIIAGVPAFGLETFFIALQVALAFAVFLNCRDRRPLRFMGALLPLGLAIALLIFQLRTDRFNLAKVTPCKDEFPPQKIFCLDHSHEIHTFESLGQRIDVTEGKKRKLVYFDGLQNDGIYGDPAETYRKDPRIIDGLLQNPKVLIIGAAAQGILNVVKQQTSSANITAFEHNPAIVELMSHRYFDFSQRAYGGIDLHVSNALPFLLSTAQQFDLITLMNTHTVKTGSFVGGPQYLHTYESAKEYFRHLKPDGYVVVEEKDRTTDGIVAFERIVRTFQQAMSDSGIANPDASTFVYQWSVNKEKLSDVPVYHQFNQAVFKKGVFTQDDRDRVQRWLELPSLSTYARMTNIQVDRDGGFRPVNPPDELMPITNDRPFPYSLQSRSQQLKSRLFPVNLVIFSILGILLWVRTWFDQAQRPSWREGAFAGLSGFGFLLVEIVLMERYERFAMSPTLSLISVLCVLLSFAGLGGYLCSRLSSAKTRAALLAALGMIAFHAFGLDRWIGPALSSPLIMVLTFALSVAPLAFCLGIPLPYLLRLSPEPAVIGAPSRISWLLSVNFLFSAAAVAVAPLLTAAVGYTGTFEVILFCYGVCILILPSPMG